MSSISYNQQIEVFNSLGYYFNQGVTKDVLEQDIDEGVDELFKKYPFSRLYYFFGWRGGYPFINFSEHCIWYDLEFIDSSDDYIWFMKRMGDITHGEISFDDIEIVEDKKGIESIVFKVNGISKKWRLEEVGIISDSFFQRFSYLPTELKTKGKYTYYDDGGQQFVIDYAKEEEQREFIAKTGLKREWLGEGGHFSEPIKEKRGFFRNLIRNLSF